MARNVKLASIQPPFPAEDIPPEGLAEKSIELLDQALAGKPDLVCLPEYLNCLGFMESSPQECEKQFRAPAYAMLEAVSARARASQSYVVLPLVIEAGGRRFNRAHLLGRDGALIGYFDKVHVTQVERDQFGIDAGSDWPVFELDFGRIGIMICYDGCFMESSRMLAVNGAEIILWPSLQRSYTREELELQTRCHAYFNYTVIVRSSYGRRSTSPGLKADISGLSSICGAEGKMLASVDGIFGLVSAEVDLDCLPRGERTFGGAIGCLRKMRFQDRRPSTYYDLASLLDNEVDALNLSDEIDFANDVATDSSLDHSKAVPSPHLFEKKRGQPHE